MRPTRTILEKCTDIQTCYKDKKGNFLDSKWLGEGAFVTPSMNIAIHKLKDSIVAEGGTFRVSDIFRTWEQQAEAKKNKPLLANAAGTSYHQAGCAVDVSTQELNFPIPKSKWIEKLWEISKPLGLHPVIQRPEWLPECWHLQYYGSDWEDASLKVGSPELAKCMILDCGRWNDKEDETKVQKMFVQSQLIRLGYYEVGTVDGIFGQKTNKVLQFMKLDTIPLDTLCIMLSGTLRIKI